MIDPPVRTYRLITPLSKEKFPINHLSIAMVLTAFAVLLLFPPPTLMAQEQRAWDIQQTTGPYDARVLTERSGLSVGRARFIITINDLATGEPVEGVEIVIRIKYQKDGTEGWAAAFSVPKFPGIYNAQVKFDSPGFYLLSIEIKGPLGDGTVLLEPLHIPEVKGFTSGSFVFMGLTLVLVSGAGYLWWSTVRQNKRRAAKAIPTGGSMNETTGETTGEAASGPTGQERPGTGGDARD